MKRIIVKLKNNKDFKLPSQRLSVIMQAVLMNIIKSEAADYLHSQQVNPYSQNIFYSTSDELYIWEINVLEDWLFEKLDKKLYTLLGKSIALKSVEDGELELIEIKYDSLNKLDLADAFYRSDASDILVLSFLTSTAFKQDGRYVFYPDMRLVIQNLINKYNTLFDDGEAVDQDFLQDLADSVRITSYNIRSRYFEVHKNYIPGFVGNLKIRIHGNDTIKNYLKMLFMFAEYSGVGIKTAQGMGKFRFKLA